MKKGFEKRFEKGDIVYWCHSEGSGRYAVHHGMVDDQFSDAVIIDYLASRERRLIDGVPINQFQNEDRYKKIPKGWTYNTSLFEITYEPLTDEEKEFTLDISNPKTIKDAYNKGFLVKDSTIFHGEIRADITKSGFRIIKRYPIWQHHIDHTSVRPDKVYFTFKEAKKEVDENIAEFQRQANLSDYDWSIEQIDKTLNMYKHFADCSDKEIQSYREWLLGMKNVEDIETRLFNGNIQWKYWKNKRWNYIEI